MSVPQRITMVGNGGFGNAIAVLLARKGLPVTIWGNDAEYLEQCAATRSNPKYLPEVVLPETISHQPDLIKALDGADLVIQAVPTRHLRSVFEGARGNYDPQTPLVSLTKGIEQQTLKFPSEIIAECTGAHSVAVLSGPSMAEEIVRMKPASVTVAHENQALATNVQELCNTPYFRVYANTDRVGVELCGAVKNVIAIAAGISDGMGLGDNAKAALLARGMAELGRLAKSLGAKEETISGLAGIGDLFTTCASPFGRNRAFGERLGQGMSLDEATQASGGMVVEGVNTAQSLIALAEKQSVELPIAEAVHAVLYQGVSSKDALEALMTRELRHE